MSSARRLSVMVVDDHPLMRDGLRDALQQCGEFDVIGQTGDGNEAVRMAQDLQPDVIVMDVMMPNMDGVEACRQIVEFLPGARVLMLTASAEDETLVRAVAAGAMGYLLKDTGRDDLLAAVRGVAAGRLEIPTQALRRALATVQGDGRNASYRNPDVLTTREQQILRLFASGKSDAQIAAEQSNSVPTIRNAIYRIQDKLGVDSRPEMVVWAVRSGLLDDD